MRKMLPGMRSVAVLVLVLCGAHVAFAGTATLVQQHYRWRNDNGSETTATWKANANTALSSVARDANIRLRFCVANTGTYAGTIAARLEYAEATAGPWTAVGTEGNGSTVFETGLSSYYANGTSTTALLTMLTIVLLVSPHLSDAAVMFLLSPVRIAGPVRWLAILAG